MSNLLQSKAKNILAIVFSSIYAFMIFLSFDFNLTHYASFRYTINAIFTDTLSLLLPIAIIVFVALKNNQGAFKKWLLPVVFGVVVVRSSFALFMSFANTVTVFNNEIHPIIWMMLLCSSLSFAAMVLMFVGTLGNFKLVALLKFGALAAALLVLFTLALEFISLGGVEYFKTISDISAPLFWINLIKTHLRALSQILFYIGLFILFPSKKTVSEAA